MRKASGRNPTTKKTEADQFDTLLETEDFKNFLRIATVTGSIPEDNLTELDKSKLIDQYNVWVENERPLPQMPQSVKKGVEEILRIYRRKSNGNQFISYLVKGKSEQTGMETTITYGKNGDNQEDKTIIIARDRKPVIKYTEKLARDIVAKAKRYNPETFKMYFVYQSATIRVMNEENFFGDFDKLVERAMKKEII